MKKLTRTSWINAGFNILDNEGYTRCSVERVARKLDVTRGSFYHHFNDREDFIRSMLSCWVVEYTDKILNELEQETSINKVLTEYINFTSRKVTYYGHCTFVNGTVIYDYRSYFTAKN
ncbi:TetR/AcrR family transcriptional regulator [Providencia rettgeri]|nr:TetR/AcrR family transcriptional regulator [Providencia rettgeri]